MDIPDRTIVFVNNFPGPGLGGGEQHLLRLVRGCVAAEMRVHVICQEGSPVEAAATEAGAIAVPMRLEGASVFGASSAIRGYCAEVSADILHTTGYFTNLLGRLARRGGRPALVNTVHVEPDAHLAAGGGRGSQILRDAADHVTATRADLVLPVSEAISSSLPPLGYDAERTRVIHNGVDVAAIRREAGEPIELPEGFEDAPLVGIVARLEQVKAVDVFVRAAALVAAERRDVRFVVAGEGPLREELIATAHRLKLADRVAFLGWVEPTAPLLSRLDACVLTSRSEGMPITVLEAMALGVPVVASAVGGVPEAVVDGETGLLVRSGGDAAFAGAITRLLADPDLAERMGAASRERVERSFSLDAMIAAHLDAYAELLADTSAAPAVRE